MKWIKLPFILIINLFLLPLYCLGFIRELLMENKITRGAVMLGEKHSGKIITSIKYRKGRQWKTV